MYIYKGQGSIEASIPQAKAIEARIVIDHVNPPIGNSQATEVNPTSDRVPARIERLPRPRIERIKNGMRRMFHSFLISETTLPEAPWSCHYARA